MRRRLISLALLFAANAIGLFVASLAFDRMDVDVASFLFVVALFTVVMVVAAPLLGKGAERWAPALSSGLAVITVYVSLLVTDLLLDGFEIEGVGTWIGATMVVWIFTVLAGILLPKIFLERRVDEGR